MMSEDLRRFLKPDFKFLGFIWLAFLASAAGCYFVVRFLGRDWGPGDRVEIGYATVFYVLAGVLAIVSLLHHRRAFDASRVAGCRARGLASNARTVGAVAGRDGFEDLDPYDRILLVVFAHIQSSYLVTWALQEAVAVVGLALAIATRNASYTVLFSLAALALLVAARPRAAHHLERAARSS